MGSSLAPPPIVLPLLGPFVPGLLAVLNRAAPARVRCGLVWQRPQSDYGSDPLTTLDRTLGARPCFGQISLQAKFFRGSSGRR